MTVLRQWLFALVLTAGALSGLVALVSLVGLVPNPWPAMPVEPVARQPHIVVVAQEHPHPYWEHVRAGAAEAAGRLGVTLEFVGPERWTVHAHTRLLDMAIAGRPDGIITQGLSEQDFTPLINKAIQRGIPVITIDTDSPSRRLAYVGTDNYQSGLVAGRLLVEATGGQARVGIITGSLHAANQVERVQGIRDAIAPYPGIREVALEESNISLIGATEAALRILEQHPEVSALIGTSALDAPGAARAMATAGRRELVLIGWDDLAETLALLRNGRLYGTVVQKPYEMGVRSVELMVDYLQGNPIPARVDTGVHILRPDDLQAAAGGGRP